MLINVTGQRKIIPGIGLFPPVKNYDATEALVRRLVVFNEWQVYQSEKNTAGKEAGRHLPLMR